MDYFPEKYMQVMAKKGIAYSKMGHQRWRHASCSLEQILQPLSSVSVEVNPPTPATIQKPLKSNVPRAQEMTLAVRYLPCNHEDLSLSKHSKKLAVAAHACRPTVGRQMGGDLDLTGQSG